MQLWSWDQRWPEIFRVGLSQISRIWQCSSKSISLWNIDPSLGKRRLTVIVMLLTSSWCVQSYLPQHLALWCQKNASFFKKTLSHPISALKNIRPLLLQLKTFLFLFASHLQMLCCLSTYTHFEVLLSPHWYTSFATHFQHSILFSFVGNNYNFDFCSLQHYNISFIYMQQLFQMTSKSVQARYSPTASQRFPMYPTIRGIVWHCWTLPLSSIWLQGGGLQNACLPRVLLLSLSSVKLF